MNPLRRRGRQISTEGPTRRCKRAKDRVEVSAKKSGKKTNEERGDATMRAENGRYGKCDEREESTCVDGVGGTRTKRVLKRERGVNESNLWIVRRS